MTKPSLYRSSPASVVSSLMNLLDVTNLILSEVLIVETVLTTAICPEADEVRSVTQVHCDAHDITFLWLCRSTVGALL